MSSRLVRHGRRSAVEWKVDLKAEQSPSAKWRSAFRAVLRRKVDASPAPVARHLRERNAAGGTAEAVQGRREESESGDEGQDGQSVEDALRVQSTETAYDHL